MQRELSWAGTDWPGSERQLSESSSLTNQLPNAGSSANPVIEILCHQRPHGRRLENRLEWPLGTSGYFLNQPIAISMDMIEVLRLVAQEQGNLVNGGLRLG